MTVAMIKSGVKGFANAVKRYAVKDKKFAEELAFIHNIRSEITPNALKPITKDMFDKAGKLTEKGKNEISRMSKEVNLPENATWDELFAAIRKYKDSLPKLQLPKFKTK